jgi:hypothetical protein
MNGARETWIAYVTAAVLGLLLWAAAAVAEMRVEPWDAPSYWTITYPAALALSGLLGFIFPERPWRWALTLMFMQLPVMSLGGSGSSLLPMGLILMAVLALPGIGLAYLCAWARWKTKGL